MIDRELLENEVLVEVCACWYYDLADGLYETLDEDLLAIVSHTSTCDICGA
jgi:hypothetical protein